MRRISDLERYQEVRKGWRTGRRGGARIHSPADRMWRGCEHIVGVPGPQVVALCARCAEHFVVLVPRIF